MSQFVAVDHPRFRRVESEVFSKRVVPDCMVHRCSLVKLGHREKADACCQYGVDADLGERDQILARANEIAAVLRPEVQGKPWFKTEEQADKDFPSGAFVRTQTHDDGCIFLAHDRRGCAIHRASIEGNWDFNGVKPHVCRLFPLSYDAESILISDDYTDYSCAYDEQAPTLYQVGRETLAAVFGADLVTALDAVEKRLAEDRGSAALQASP